MSQYGHETYLSPFTWRYGTPEMRTIWSVAHQRLIWRRIWVALATAQCDEGLVTPAQVEDLRAHMNTLDLERAQEIENEIRHDVMSEVKTFAEQCSIGGGVIHLGATSMDVQDNADAVRLGEALDVVIDKTSRLIQSLAGQIEAEADSPTMGFTHLQPAEPTTVGYRLAQYGQDLLEDLVSLRQQRASLRGKGFKGATGTSASYAQLLGDDQVGPRRLEARTMEQLGISAFEVATQTAPRKQEFSIISALASLGQSLYKFAFDLRILQSPVIGELAEPFGAKQVGSSAMPFKRNPIDAENIDSLARLLAALPRVAWDNAAHSLLERTLDDSANRRTVLPESFLLVDEILRKAQRVVDGLRIDRGASAALMATYGPFAATERLLMEAVKRGGDRQELHEVIRTHALSAWAALREGQENPLIEGLVVDKTLLGLMSSDDIRRCLCADDYLGDAPLRARNLVLEIKRVLEEDNQ
jgi:adenylosuccinate lyase